MLRHPTLPKGGWRAPKVSAIGLSPKRLSVGSHSGFSITELARVSMAKQKCGTGRKSGDVRYLRDVPLFDTSSTVGRIAGPQKK